MNVESYRRRAALESEAVAGRRSTRQSLLTPDCRGARSNPLSPPCTTITPRQ
jgi:hypothetical protein